MTSTTHDLEQRISREFLQCQICFEDFKQPKSLPCLHTFCQECLSSYLQRQPNRARFDCPLCRNVVDVPPGGVKAFKTNFIIQNLQETISSTPSKNDIQCQSCENDKALVFCEECEELLCEECKSAHGKVKVTRGHRLTPLSEHQKSTSKADITPSGKDIAEEEALDGSTASGGSNWHCRAHPPNKVSSFCLDCSAPMCAICIGELLRTKAHPHKNHNITSTETAMKHFQTETKVNHDKIMEKASDVETELSVLEDKEVTLDRSRDQAIQSAEQRAKELIQLINNWKGNVKKKITEDVQKLKEPLLANKAPLMRYVESIQECSKLAQEIMSTKDISFLQRKDEIRGKLATALIAAPDTNVSAPIAEIKMNFSKGKVTHGDIEPLLGRMSVEASQASSLRRFGSQTSVLTDDLEVEDEDDEDETKPIPSLLGLAGMQPNIAQKKKGKISFKRLTSFRIPDVTLVGMCCGKNGSVFFVDSVKKEVLQYKLNGLQFKFVNKLGTKAASKGKVDVAVLKEPLDVDQLPNGNIVVSDGKEGHAFKVINSNTGKLEANLAHGVLKKAVGIAVTPDGNVVVSDVDEQMIFCFKVDGQKAPIVFQIDKHLERKQFTSPQYVACSPDGRVAVCDREKSIVKVFKPDGSFLFMYGRWGKTPIQMQKPEGVCFDARGRLYVSDVDNSRIHILSPHGRLQAHIFVQKAFGPFNPFPTMIAIDPHGNLIMVNSKGVVKLLGLTFGDG